MRLKDDDLWRSFTIVEMQFGRLVHWISAVFDPSQSGDIIGKSPFLLITTDYECKMRSVTKRGEDGNNYVGVADLREKNAMRARGYL